MFKMIRNYQTKKTKKNTENIIHTKTNIFFTVRTSRPIIEQNILGTSF